MLDHVALQCDDVRASKEFYRVLLAPLDVRVVMEWGDHVGYGGSGGQPRFWLGPSTGGNQREVHVAFVAADRQAVEAVHQAALELSAEVLHAPREWPQYHAGYYGVFVRDPDGNNVEAVSHR